MLGFCAMDKIQAPPQWLQRGHLWWNECHLVVEAGSYLGKRHDINEPRGGSRTWGMAQKCFHLREHAGYFSCWDAADSFRALAAILTSLWLCALLLCSPLSTENGHRGWCSSWIAHKRPPHWKQDSPKIPFSQGNLTAPPALDHVIRHKASLALSVV